MLFNDVKKIVIWGNLMEYEAFIRSLEPEILKGTMEIIGFVPVGNVGFKSWDGVKVYSIEELPALGYDYIVDMNQNERETINRIIELLRLDASKIIPVKVFHLPGFDFNEYLSLKESKLSIIASHCWGGMVSHYLGLPFYSPFINMYVEPDGFLKLVESLDKYMNLPVDIVGSQYDEGLKHDFPIGQLDDIRLYFQHYISDEEALSAWYRRRERINYKNIFIEMVCKTEADIDEFLKLEYPNKIAFTSLDVREDRIIKASTEELEYVNYKYNGNLAWYECDKALDRTPFSRRYDIIKLLLGKNDFLR